MSCCSKGYCDFKFPDGAPLLDNSVQSLNTRFQFLPYGTLLQAGETVRIWMESGQTKTVIIEAKYPINYETGILKLRDDNSLLDMPVEAKGEFSWQLVAFDSGFNLADIESWPRHELYNPASKPELVVYQHPIEPKKSIKDYWLEFLYKMRNLGR